LFRFSIIFAISVAAAAAERDALEISAAIQQRHSPFGTILDPFLTESGSTTGYTRCGDSAIWTGHYLAAEAYRYAVTADPAALKNVRGAIDGIRSLVDVTGTDLLARCLVPVESPFSPGIASEEAGNGIYTGNAGGSGYLWVGDTSRDQYAGVFFGLSVAHDLIEDAPLRADIAGLVTRMLDFLIAKDWAVVMPGGSISTVFWLRADQQLSLLSVGRRVNPSRFETRYETARSLSVSWIGLPIRLEVLDEHNSYFKFNIDAICFFSLIRLEENPSFRAIYMNAYEILVRATDDHGNAHFNMIDRALRGPDERRDVETRNLLKQWLERPRRDLYVDLRGRYPACGADRACSPIPVSDRVNTDFLWQRSPFLLYGGWYGADRELWHRLHPPVLDGTIPRSHRWGNARSATTYSKGTLAVCVETRLGTIFALLEVRHADTHSDGR
jgi:hypothetical protein